MTTLLFASSWTKGLRRLDRVYRPDGLLAGDDNGRPSHHTATAHQINDQDHHGYYEEQVDQTAGHMEAET